MRDRRWLPHINVAAAEAARSPPSPSRPPILSTGSARHAHLGVYRDASICARRGSYHGNFKRGWGSEPRPKQMRAWWVSNGDNSVAAIRRVTLVPRPLLVWLAIRLALHSPLRADAIRGLRDSLTWKSRTPKEAEAVEYAWRNASAAGGGWAQVATTGDESYLGGMAPAMGLGGGQLPACRQNVDAILAEE